MRGSGLRGLLAFVAIAALTLGVLQGAGTAAGPSRDKVPIQRGNYNCGTDNGGTVLGYVTFVRRGQDITLTVSLKTVADTTFNVALWSTAGGCTGIASGWTLRTNSRGTARETFTATYTGSSSTFLAGVFSDGGIYGGNTTEASLP